MAERETISRGAMAPMLAPHGLAEAVRAGSVLLLPELRIEIQAVAAL